MNIIDLAIVAMIAISILFGFYQGFVVTLLNLLGTVASWLASTLFYGKLALWISQHTGWLDSIRHYTEGSLTLAQTGASVAADIETMRTSVDAVAPANVTSIVTSAQLPPPLDGLIEGNILGKVFENTGAATMGDYCNRTLAEFTLNVLSFLLIFLGVSLVVSILVGLVKSVVRLPVLRQLDGLGGGIMGLLRGILMVLAIFLLLPVGLSIVNVPMINDLVAGSSLAGFFYDGNFMLNAIKGFLG